MTLQFTNMKVENDGMENRTGAVGCFLLQHKTASKKNARFTFLYTVIFI